MPSDDGARSRSYTSPTRILERLAAEEDRKTKPN
jgi:hypothetical protein